MAKLWSCSWSQRFITWEPIWLTRWACTSEDSPSFLKLWSPRLVRACLGPWRTDRVLASCRKEVGGELYWRRRRRRRREMGLCHPHPSDNADSQDDPPAYVIREVIALLLLGNLTKFFPEILSLFRDELGSSSKSRGRRSCGTCLERLKMKITRQALWLCRNFLEELK